MSPRRSMASRAAMTPTAPEKKPVGCWDHGTFTLSSPAQDTERAAAVAVCDQAIRDGCGGARTPGNPEGCTSPEHGEHVWQVLEDLRELELAEEPKAGGEG